MPTVQFHAVETQLYTFYDIYIPLNLGKHFNERTLMEVNSSYSHDPETGGRYVSCIPIIAKFTRNLL